MNAKTANLVLITIGVAVAHVVEQWFLGFEQAFAEVHWMMRMLGQLFDPWQKAILFMVAIAMTALLIAVYLAIKGGAFRYYATCIVGILFLPELHHLISSIQAGAYIVGTATGTLLFMMAIGLIGISLQHLRK